MIAINLPLLRPDQLAIARHPAKIKSITMGRRWGKTILGGVVAVNALIQHGRVGWVAPVYKNTRPLWRWVSAVCGGHPGLNVLKGERMIETSRGGLLAIYSGDNMDAMRSEAFNLVVADEAARLREEDINDVIMPTLADADGDLMLISTPVNKNWFYHVWLKGNAGESGYASWQAPTSANPVPSIQRAFEAARTRVPERSFRREWLAQFLDDGGEVFRKVRLCNTATVQGKPIEGHSYMLSVDLAKSVDFTVVIVWDLSLRQAVYIDRFNGIEYTLQVQRIKGLSQLFNNALVIAEENANETTIEYMRREGLSVQAFRTTNATKSAIIEGLAVGLETQAIAYPNDPVLISELEAYSGERLPSGLMRYGAPQGLHDDCVMSLAIGWYGVTAMDNSVITMAENPFYG